ncbi:hypothetical protein LEMLEM_LOCUS10815, partial [Lemmus lemmus]
LTSQSISFLSGIILINKSNHHHHHHHIETQGPSYAMSALPLSYVLSLQITFTFFFFFFFFFERNQQIYT